MANVYIVYTQKNYELEDETPIIITDKVFTNKKLAEAYVKYWNNEPNHTYHYWMNEHKINKSDYRNLLKLQH